jgi:uncharacterized repeat protein (TIGR01451 family)
MNFFTRRSKAAAKPLTSAATTMLFTLVAALALPLATAQRPVSSSQNVPVQTPRTNPTVQDGTTLTAPRGDGQSVALPLASIGRQVGWKIPPDDFRINVPAAAAGRETSIEVFSPEINRNDYANARDRVTYYGDELYGRTATLETQFRLTDSKNTALFSRSFGTGLQHGYEALFRGTLPAGIYPFRVSSEGNGKNSFALRATNGLRVEASQFTVTARGQFNRDQLVAFVQIDRSAIGKTVELANYDADGKSEIVLTLVAPDGRRFPLTASEDTTWASNKFKVTADLVGNWKILGQILPTTRQFSNSFAFRLRIEDKPLYSFLPGFTPTTPPVVPLKVDVVDTLGNPIPGSSYTVTGVGGNRVAQPVLPACWTPVSANILAGQGTVNSNTRVTITSNSGHIRFVADCPKAKVQVVAVAQVCGQTVSLPGVPFTSSTGARGTTPATFEATPGSLTVTGAAQSGASTNPVTVNAPRNQTTTVTLVYDVALALELQPQNLDLTVGETSTISAVVNSVFATPVPANIAVTLPEGLEALGATTQSGNVSASAPLVLRIPVKATKPISSATIRAALEPNCGVTAVSNVRVVPPPSEPAKLGLTKSVDRNLVKTGERVSYTITVSNTGGSTARDVRLTDVLPSGLSGDNLDQTFDLEPGQSRRFVLPAIVVQTVEGEIINVARVLWEGETLEADATIRLEPPPPPPAPPILSLTKTVDRDLVRPNDRATYTVVVVNTGASAARDVRLTDILPEGVRGENLEQRFDLNAGQSRSFRIPVTVTRSTAGEIVNTARVTWSGEPLEASATMRVEIPVEPQPVLSLTKVADRELVRPGERVNFTIVVVNTGAGVARDVRLTDVLPTGLVGTNLDQSFVLQPGQSRTFRLSATVADGVQGELTNIARVTWSGEPLSAAATVRVEPPPPVVVPPPPAALTLTKVVDKDLVEIGERVNFTIVVTNTGGTVANNVRLTDTLPEGLTGANISQTFSLQPGQSQTIQLPATVAVGASGQITNTARVSWSGEPLSASASVRVKPPAPVVPQAVPQIDLAVSKRALPTNLKIGEKTSFLIVVTNNGPDTATNVLMSDPLPIELEYDAATTSQGEVSFANGVVTASLGDLARGRSASIQISVIAREVGTFNNVANVQGDQTETNLDNNRAQASVTVTPVIDLSLSKSVTPSQASTNQEIEYRLQVQNLGPSPASEVVLTDPVPEGLQYIGANTSQGVLSYENGTLTARIGTLNVGQVATITVRANTSRAGTFTNIATVKGAEPESRLDNNTARAQVVVTAPIIRTDLEIQKSVSPTRAAVGQGALYTIVVRNNGPQPASNVVMNDPIPAGLEYVSATASKGTVSQAGSIVSANIGALAVGESATITVRVNTTRAGTFNNTATVAGLETETRLDNNSASAVLEAFVPTGILNVSAASLNCAAKAPIVGTAFTIGGTRYTTPARIELPIGEYTIVPETLADATAAQPRVTVLANQNSNAEIVYAVQSRVEVSPRILSVTAGQNITVRAIASSNFPFPIATAIALRLPEQVTPTGTITKTGTVAANAPLVLEVPVRALRPIASTPIAVTLEPNCAADTGNLQILAAPLPAQRRETQVVLLAKLAEVTPTGSRLILSDRIPAGSSYISGSSSLVANPTFGTNTPTQAPGAPLADPYMAGDRLFWVVPTTQATTYGVTYRLAHTGALQMPEDRVAAFLALPSNRSAGVPRNPIAADSPMGRLLGAGELRQLQGDPSILGVLAQALPFAGSSGTATTVPRPVGGFATSLRVTAVRPTTDSADQPSIKFEAFDKDGLPAKDEFVTIQINADPADPDAAPALTGYQVRLQNGVGLLRLQSLQTRALDTLPQDTLRVDARIANPNGVVSSSHDFRIDDFSVLAQNPIDPNATPIAASSRPTILVGMLSGLVRYDFGTGNFSADGGLRLFLRGDTGLGLLTIGINWQADYDPSRAVDPLRLSGSLLPPANPYEFLPLLGDSSILGADVRSTEGFYARLEGGNNYLMFGQFTPQFSGVLSNYNLPYNGISGAIRTDGFGIRAFATDTPNSNTTVRLPANGTDLYFLPATNINQNSEQIAVVVYSKDNPTLRLSRQVLVRNTDYRIDYETGLVRLTKAITSRDANLNPQFLEVSYGSATVARDFRFGVQASLGSPELNLTATAVQFRNGSFGNNSSFLLSGGVNVQSGGFQLGVEVAQSGVFGDSSQSNLGVGAQLNWTIGSFQARLRYQDLLPNYIDPETNSAATPGRSLVAGMTLGDPNGLAFNANLDHNQSYVSSSGATNASAGVQLALGDGWSIGLGLQGRYSFPSDLFELFGTAGLNANLGGIRLGLLQRVPLLGIPGSYGDTEASLEVPLGAGFSVLLKDKLTYEPNGIRQQINFGVKASFTNSDLLRVITGNTAFVPGQFGQTNVSATYDLLTTDGNAGRARIGLDTLIPLGGNLSTQLAGEAVFEPTGGITGSASIGVLYSDDAIKGLARAQLGFAPTGLRQVYTAGIIAQLGDEFVISPKIEYAIDPAKAGEQQGAEFSIAGAYRGDDFNVLTNHRAKTGFYSLGDDYVEGEIQFGYQANERLYIRLGAQYRNVIDSGIFTGLVSGGFTWFVTDTFAVGAQGGYYFQPITNFAQIGFGVEASLKVVDRLLFTVGYNVLGFNGVLGNAFRPGVYFRLDWKLDENLFR